LACPVTSLAQEHDGTPAIDCCGFSAAEAGRHTDSCGYALNRASRNALVTKSLYVSTGSSRRLHAAASIVTAMDVVAIVLGIVMFALLLLMLEGIDRV
jgi:hypothetical protein